MELLNENREEERKEKPIMIDGQRKKGILLIDMNHERIQVDF